MDEVVLGKGPTHIRNGLWRELTYPPPQHFLSCTLQEFWVLLVLHVAICPNDIRELLWDEGAQVHLQHVNAVLTLGRWHL